MIGSEKLEAERYSAMPGPINETTKQVWKTGVGDRVIKGGGCENGGVRVMMSAESQANHGLAWC